MSTFTSNFAPEIEAMPDWRTSLGHTLRDMRNAMAGFDRFCSSHHPGETVLTRELATAWCRDTATGTWGAYRSRACRVHRDVRQRRPSGSSANVLWGRPGPDRTGAVRAR